MRVGGRLATAAATLLVGVLGLLFTSSAAFGASSTLVVSQVYGGGGNSGATYTHDFIEVFNRSLALIDTTGMSVQYGSTTGNIGSASNLVTPLSGFLSPGQYLLVQEAQGTGGTTPLPSPDVTDATPIAMSATGGKVALVSSTTGLNCGATATPCGAAALAQIVDLVGYDGANMFEGAPTPTLSNTTAALRNGSGCTDTDNNASDFTVGAPNPRNRSFPTFDCNGDLAPSVASTTPANGATDVATSANVSITFSEPVNVSGSWYSISCGSSGSHTATASGGPTTFTLDPTADFATSETCTVTVFAANVSDQDTNDPPDTMTANYVFSFTTVAPAVAIHDIQGSSHISPLAGQNVSQVTGIVTAKRSNGYYIQDPNPDASDATSEGIFVFTSSAPSSVNVGDSVKVNGRVQEFRPGGASSTNLTTTELTTPTTTVLSSGNPLPAATVAGTGGRVPPSDVIEDDATGDVETSGVFDPATDGLDFWESLEGMRLQLNDVVAVGPTNSFGETPVVGDDGANASVRTARGGLVIRPTDFNPERLVLDDVLVPIPAANVGDHYGSVGGVLDYNFGLFMLEVTASPSVVHDGVTPESTAAAGLNQVGVATFNFENLDPTDPQSKFDRLAGILVNSLRSPDIVSGEEVQDNTGPANDGTVDADVTLDTLVSAIQSAGGPTYDYRYINPVNNQDGGEPGGNIRQVFLFRTDRGVSFVDRPGGGSTTATTVVSGPNGPELSSSPGRIDPNNSAFNASRKPLAGEFLFNGHHLFVIANHFNSKGGDQPLEGHFQPPTRSSEVQRHQQAQIVHDFVASILSADPDAGVVVDGDLNDFEFSDTVSILRAGVLHDLIETLPQNERYSYVFEGNSQTLDHILTSDALFGVPFVYDVVHVNSEFADQASDHEPSVARITLNSPPSADAGGPYSVGEGGSVAVAATGTDPEAGPLGFDWDLDDNGSFETSGQNATFSAAGLDGPSTRTITVRVTDDGGLAAIDQATVQVTNVAPSVASPVVAPEPSTEGASATASATFTDPAPNDGPFGCTVDYGDGSGQLAGTVSAGTCTGPAHTYAAAGSYTVTVRVTDKDGGTGTGSSTHSVYYNFTGFFQPVDNLPTLNSVKAGLGVPVKFSLGGYKGLAIFAPGYPKSETIACNSTDPVDGIEETVSAGGSSLSYDPSSDRYSYAWKTEKGWAQTCRQLVVKLNDGSSHRANFKFTK